MIETNLLGALGSSLASVFAWPALGLLFLGIVIGLIVGLLPGLGAPAMLALMMPFTFNMQPVEAFSFLLGMFAVAATAGDLTSILFGVPGEAVSAALVLDGYPMAKRGEAGRALGAALASSVVGAVVGAVALVLAIPVVRPLVLSFGSPEFFMLTVVGISLVAVLGGREPLKGLIVGAAGLLLAMIGLDSQNSIQRFTFGMLHFWDGVGLVPVSIGLFAIPEIVDLAVRGTSVAGGSLSRIGGVLEGVRDTFRHGWLVIRCSLIGTFAGLLPGLGGAVGQWFAYAHAMQSSRSIRQFGTGAIEGVLGPGAANNSKEGGSLIPMVSFGIPSSGAMAILMGAFLIHGLVPGPAMLTKQLNVTMSFVWIIVLSNIVTAGVCLLFVRQLVKLTQIRGSLLIPVLILLVFVGSFAEKNVLLDIVTMLVFGLIGLAMVRLKWPRAPLVLGLVLGQQAERFLFLSVASYDLAWLKRPIVLGLAVVVALAIILPLIGRVLKARTPHPVEDDDKGEARPIRRWDLGFDLLFGLAVLAAASAALWQAQAWPFLTRLFPNVLGITLATLLALFLVHRSIAWVRLGSGSGGFRPEELVTVRRTGAIVGWMLGFGALVWLVGFPVGSPLAAMIYMRTTGREGWTPTLVMVVAIAAVMVLLERLGGLPFPEGVLVALARGVG